MWTKINNKNFLRVKMASKFKFDEKDAKEIAKRIGIDFNKVDFTLKSFVDGLNVELEHGTIDKDTNVTNDDPDKTGKIAWIHLKETPIYYDLLKIVEKEG